MPQVEEIVPCLAFPYVKQGELVNLKYRAIDQKAFRQVSGAEKVLYRQDHIQKELVIITEGEWDALACVAAGFDSVVSVPDGAPAPTAKNYTAKFTYLDQEPDPFAEVQRIVLAVDGDEPGRVLREELARRLGRDRCYTVTWPEGCKDANEVLMRHGPQVLRQAVSLAQPWPVEDALTVEALTPEILTLAERGLPRGLSTGWSTLDRVFTIAPGQLTIITGIPSHGKSQVVDALAVNLMQLHGWRFVICSPEHYPTALHGVTLLEKWTGKTVRRDPPYPMQTVTREESAIALREMHESFTFIAPPDSLTILDLLARAEAFVRRQGIQGLIIDPWNEFDHTRDRHLTEVEYINTTLGLVRRWARKWSVHIFLVAHPTKMLKRDDGTYPVPTPYDINGGAAWRNKSDNCLSVWRSMEPNDFLVDIHIQKVKWRNLGTMGEKVQLRFDAWTGQYFTTQ
jgi:twinkle protein